MTSNILIRTVSIPSSIAATSTDVWDYLVSQRVSEHLRQQLIITFSQKFSAAWKKVVQKIAIKVNAKFADGSSAIYVLGSPFFSDHPYILDRSSVKDKDGNKASSENSGGVDGGENYSFGDSYASSGLQDMALQCRTYTIMTSGGYSWSGFNCWFVGIP